MRSRAFWLGIATSSVVLMGVSCLQRGLTKKTSVVASDEATTGAALVSRSAPPTVWPGISQTAQPQSIDIVGANSLHAAASDGHPNQSTLQFTEAAGDTAVITAQNEDALINVRSLPSLEADLVGQGSVGDAVAIDGSEQADDGQTWYQITFEDTPTTGWIHSDFLDLQAGVDGNEVAAVSQLPRQDVLKEALDEHCGGPGSVQAYFTTQNHTIYLCNRRGELMYLSQEAGTNQVFIADDAQAVGGGYVVVNDRYEYRLDSSTFTVVRIDDDGEETEILRDSVLHSERY